MIELKKFAEVSREQVMEAWNVSFADYVVEMMLTEEAFFARMDEFLLDPNLSCLALFEGQPVGFSLFAREGNYSWCGGIGVAPEFRGKKVADLLMDDMLQKASGTQFKLEVITANERAVHFYQKHQFDIINELYFLDGPLGEASEIVIEQPEMEAENDLLTPWQNQPRFKKEETVSRFILEEGKGSFHLRYALSDRGIEVSKFELREGTILQDALAGLGFAFGAEKKLFLNNCALDKPLADAFLEAGFLKWISQWQMVRNV
ncbi:GNAT family N-acetyltransferase [Listeria aquatica]|uniref:GNAT family N-acetyltransferase n=1 Tax=Listeria aquatica TaxID=1494960 RepID=UPI003EF9BB2C